MLVENRRIMLHIHLFRTGLFLIILVVPFLIVIQNRGFPMGYIQYKKLKCALWLTDSLS